MGRSGGGAPGSRDGNPEGAGSHPEQVAEREAIINHDLAAFRRRPGGGDGTGREWVHYGLTSSDVVDTASGAIMDEAARLLIGEVGKLFSVLREAALEHRDTLMLGRTHGMWAEPTSWGLKLANWAFQVARDHERLSAARQAVAVGKVSGRWVPMRSVPRRWRNGYAGGWGSDRSRPRPR